MQRISLKHVVFLALLVMSFSLVPSTIVHSAPDGRPLVPSEEQAAEAVTPVPDAGNKFDNVGGDDDQEKLRTGAGFEAPETLESLRHDLDQLKEELKTTTESSAQFGIRLEIILAAAALLASVVSILLSWILFQDLDKDFKRLKASLNNFEKQIRLQFGGLQLCDSM